MGLRGLLGKVAASLSDGLEAGRFGRRLANWVPSRVHVNTLIQASGGTTLARARYLVRNNGYAANAVDCFASNLVGAGIVPSWTPPAAEISASSPAPMDRSPKEAKIGDNGGPDLDDDLGDEGQDDPLKISLQQLWTDWTDEADADGLTDFYGLERRVGRELFIAGEVFVRLRPRFLTDGLSVPLQIQVLPGEMLPLQMTQPADNGNFIRQGIEFNAIGRRVAYHFWKQHPGDATIQSVDSGQTTRVPAESVLHIFDPVEAGQIRGLSKLTPAIVPLWMHDSYDDAEHERKRTAALFSVFIRRPDPNGDFFDQAAEHMSKYDEKGGTTINLTPATAHTLFPGEDVTMAGPADVGNSYEAFQYRNLLRICAGLGLPYPGVTGDPTKSNYSSQRMMMIDLRRRCEALQHGVMVFQFCRPIWQAFLQQAVLAGAVKLPGFVDDPKPYYRVTWIPPRWDWIDPLKDLQAEAIAVNNGFKPRSTVVEADGRDPIENDRKIARDQRRLKRLGVVLVGTPTPAKEIANPPPEEQSVSQQQQQQQGQQQ